jgi:hypothetical protein
MHSRLFQLSEEVIAKDNYIEEQDLYDSFVGPIADYVEESENRIDDLGWLASELTPHGATIDIEQGTVYLPKGFKISYFKKRYEEFKKLAGRISLEAFAGVDGAPDAHWKHPLEMLIENKFGFYVYTDYLQTLSDFVRYAKEDTTYYVGAIFDYHY